MPKFYDDPLFMLYKTERENFRFSFIVCPAWAFSLRLFYKRPTAHLFTEINFLQS